MRNSCKDNSVSAKLQNSKITPTTTTTTTTLVELSNDERNTLRHITSSVFTECKEQNMYEVYIISESNAENCKTDFFTQFFVVSDEFFYKLKQINPTKWIHDVSEKRRFEPSLRFNLDKNSICKLNFN